VLSLLTSERRNRKEEEGRGGEGERRIRRNNKK
jgi:hypothetical protein